MPHPALEKFTRDMDLLVLAETDPHVIAGSTASHLAELIAVPEFLEARFRRPSDQGYQQHVVHVHPDGRYSIVALVWLPGQATPVHDHRCWCVVGVLQGQEAQTRFHLYEEEGSGQRFLDAFASEVFSPGEVCALVPPEEDIHLVRNQGDGVGISIHVYGADIARVGSSINHVFDLPVHHGPPSGAKRIAWREFDDVAMSGG